MIKVWNIHKYVVIGGMRMVLSCDVSETRRTYRADWKETPEAASDHRELGLLALYYLRMVMDHQILC